MARLLDTIQSPSDVRKLKPDELGELCRELREEIIEVCSHNPGHLASSLGAVELITGIHYVFDTPKDKLVFDVGHQSYAHKILTGRRESFRNLRAEDGTSGFPNRYESEYDPFCAGHSSTSISSALGLAESARILGKNEKVVALIGDGALTGGLAFEGLNNAGASNADILIILNDNNQSIDPNRGALHNELLRITASSRYNKLKDNIWNILGENGFRDIVQRWVRSVKSWFVKRTGGDLFEALGFRYFGPIDGNDIDQVQNVLRKLKKLEGPLIVHCITTKGKGYAPAEADPILWHAPGKFNPATGERLKVDRPADRYQDVFGQVLCDLAEKDPKVIGITPAMATGCGMDLLEKTHPEQFFDVGIEEEHSVTFSAGLAAGGLKPFCNIYSSFAQRAYDQIIHDLALQKLPVVLCFDRAGLVGEDGATHTGAFDMAALRCIPSVTISSPKDEIELKNLMYTAYSHQTGPFVIRYPRGMGEGKNWRDAEINVLPIGKAEELRKGKEIAVIAIGHCVNRALEAAENLGADTIGVYNFRFLKPLDEEMLDMIAKRYKYVLIVEDGCMKGGLYGAVCEYYCSRGVTGVTISGLGIDDEFVSHARQDAQRKRYGIDKEGIETKLKSILKQ